MNELQKNEEEFLERVISINRVTKVITGGRRFRFSVLVSVGNGKGCVGIGTGKAVEISVAIRKAVQDAKKNIIEFSLVENSIPYESVGKFGAACVLLKPAYAGTGVLAGGAVRAVLEVGGIKNILAKSLGSDNASNVARATLLALQKLKRKEDLEAEREN
ncbi:MAG: 30S ribosomal protein S5 [bacterium]